MAHTALVSDLSLSVSVQRKFLTDDDSADMSSTCETYPYLDAYSKGGSMPLTELEAQCKQLFQPCY